ncbi:Protein of unknown function (DUF890) [Babesia microti strain RI]|uniref:Uncharacterized protein n=1 Tax=Babesia microti (strain RI) TaxID=1133968 RepID=I7ISB3_BABMR|nr:Protein of unknown function (DUF890) [Babesia microti strain RI]CCF75511.1 Protein of unknown function (DUF890) [Babesia microti strain RI]|eukprot:XP_012649919.1 Protein of unknown function (DUF890) [Babesia microti strain RI]
MGCKRNRINDYGTFCHNDYLNLSKKYPYLYKHFSNDKFRRFEYIHEDSTYHISKASLIEFYGIHLKLPCVCPIIVHLNDSTTESNQEVIWNPKLVSKCDVPIISNEDDYTSKIVIAPNRYLSPCIPGRKLYLDTINSLLGPSSDHKIYNNNVKVLDVGTGASVIYPLLGCCEYGWNFVATDICDDALNIARHNVYINKLESKIVLRKQNNPFNMYNGVIDNYEFYHFTICNPPFYSSYDDRRNNFKTHKMGNTRELIFNIPHNCTLKLSQKYRNADDICHVNYGDYIIYPSGNDDLNNSLDETTSFKRNRICGELAFITLMLIESRFYCNNALWFTSLISKKINLKKLKQMINNEMARYYCQELTFQNMQNTYLDYWCKRIRGNYIKDINYAQIECKMSYFKVREIRIFEIKPGTISRWILCWTFYTSEQRDRILKSLNVH